MGSSHSAVRLQRSYAYSLLDFSSVDLTVFLQLRSSPLPYTITVSHAYVFLHIRPTSTFPVLTFADEVYIRLLSSHVGS